MYNILIIGAKDCVHNINNVYQAYHIDMCNLKNTYGEQNISITCFDMLYDKSYELDGIQYKKEVYSIDDVRHLKKTCKNVIIEFSNFLDENNINHGIYFNKELFDYNIVYLACGCGWNKGFPSECISMSIENQNIHTPFDCNNIDNFLYVISSTHSIYQENKQDIMQPYLKGIYQVMGTLKWRGSQANEYVSEKVLRELFVLIGTEDMSEITDEDSVELKAFVAHQKHWNQIKWSTRENMTKFIFGDIMK